jgi:toxin ParE1/3/4
MQWSLDEFGQDAARRYENLIFQSFRDLAENPQRTGAQQRPELATGILVYHLRHSRDRARAKLERVGSPRHFIVYREEDQSIEILRLIHDSRELARHLEDPG